MIILGITGGIGSGKTYVSKLLSKRGIPVFDCDSQAKRLTLEDPFIRKSLVALLGSDVYTTLGINKPLLANYLFASKENAARVNAIIHPRVRETFRQWAELCKKEDREAIALESAILFESGFHTGVDKVVMVYAPLDVRCARVMKRDNATIQQVKRRIASQMSDEEKRNLSDFTIDNDGIKPIDEQIDQLFSYLKGIKGHK